MSEDMKIQKQCGKLIEHGHCKAMNISKGDEEYPYAETELSKEFCRGCDFIRQMLN